MLHHRLQFEPEPDPSELDAALERDDDGADDGTLSGSRCVFVRRSRLLVDSYRHLSTKKRAEVCSHVSIHSCIHTHRHSSTGHHFIVFIHPYIHRVSIACMPLCVAYYLGAASRDYDGGSACGSWARKELGLESSGSGFRR
jgi:hypothetical protein